VTNVDRPLTASESDVRLLQRRGWLSLHEAALVLQVPVRDVRNRLRRGTLADVRPGRLRGVAVDELSRLIADRPLAQGVLEAILDGRLRVGSLPPDEPPPSLIESWDAIE
jgi:hypothetical protein